MAEAYGRLDMQATWTNAEQNLGSPPLQQRTRRCSSAPVLRHGEGAHFRQTGGTTVPRLLDSTDLPPGRLLTKSPFRKKAT